MDFNPLLNGYAQVPGLYCQGCAGDCCVSPTMTAVEFIWMMRYLIQSQPDQVQNFLQKPAAEHRHWAGNLACRFQDVSGICLNYEGRAMACRLHGHEALRLYETPDMVFCDKNPDRDKTLNGNGLENLLDAVRHYVGQVGAPYEAPFYFVSLNLESWIDFYFHPEYALGRADLEKCHADLVQWIDLKPMQIPIHTTLRAKLNAIELAWKFWLQEDYLLAAQTFESLAADYPSVGSYFLEEARNMATLAKQKAAEIPNTTNQT